MHKRLEYRNGITLIGLVVTIIILLIIVGIAISVLGGENGLISKTKLAKKKYELSEAKEKIEFAIADLRVEYEGKGENLTKEALPKINGDEIDVGSVENFPVGVICGKYKFNVDENFIVTYVGEADGTIVTYTTYPEGYTNQDEIEILIKVSNPNGIKTIEYPDGDVLEVGGATERGIDYTVTANGTYTFKIIDSENGEVIKDVVIDQIDKLEPLDFTPEVINRDGVITIKENAQDAEPDGISSKSGISYYEYYIIDDKNVTTKYDNNQIENLSLGITYKAYVIAYDRAGNTKKSNNADFKVAIQFEHIEIGNMFSLALDKKGNLWAWGYNSQGQLGDGTRTEREFPVQIKTGTKFTQISAGKSFSLAIDSIGNTYSWGLMTFGQLGNGSAANGASCNTPEIIENEKIFDKISAGLYSGGAIDKSGNIWAWGDEDDYLSFSNMKYYYKPRQITTETKFAEISVGEKFGIGIDESGNIWTWGYGGYGRLGKGTPYTNSEPVQITQQTRFKKVEAGDSHGIALDEEGNIWAWGNNSQGQVGIGDTTTQNIPVQITNRDRI